MSSGSRIDALRHELVKRYGVSSAAVRMVFAPYRICPLGAHIDHQGGRVTGMALDQGVLLAYASVPTPEARMASLDFPGEVRFSFREIPDRQADEWGNYLRGAVQALQQRYYLSTGLVGVTQGSVSEGGLSSSAAVGVAYLLSLEDVNGLRVSAEENILLDQFIENVYLGLQNGILDQSTILLSRRGHLTLIDCATVQHERVPQPDSMPPCAILIAFSGLRQALIGTDYNRRVAEGTEAARVLLRAADRVDEKPLLGNVTAIEYEAFRDRLTGAIARRAAHFFSETQRVRRGIDAWRLGNLAEFGCLMTASGDSSIRNYECGAPPLIELYRLLAEAEGVYGTRFSGAGFRGCCLALVRPENAEAIAARVREAYVQRFPDLAASSRMMLCQGDDGARILA
jgi:galacturonokinase